MFSLGDGAVALLDPAHDLEATAGRPDFAAQLRDPGWHIVVRKQNFAPWPHNVVCSVGVE